MAREIIQRTWCDPCLNAEDGPQYVEGTEVMIAIGNAKPRLLAVCEPHDKEIVQPLVHAINEWGAIYDKIKPKSTSGGGKISAAETPAGEGKCRYPACPEESTSIGGLYQHIRISHDLRKTQYDQLIAGEITLDDLGMKPWSPPPESIDPLPCGVGDCERIFEGVDRVRRTARTSHINRSHKGTDPTLPEKFLTVPA